MTLGIPLEVARRFILGKQGLWPGQRWQGLDGTEAAMRAIEQLQLDPLVLLARAHDLILHARVIDYHQDDWATLTAMRRGTARLATFLEARKIDARAVPQRGMRVSFGQSSAGVVKVRT